MNALPGFAELEEKLGYHFKTKAFLEQALTHSSKGASNNERIEFLGDRVLNLVMAEALFKKFPDENEGNLAKRHSALVQGRMLAVIGGNISIGKHIILSEAERLSGGASNENILSDAMEAVLGAVFLDGGFDSARELTLRLWDEYLMTVTEAQQDPKTELQEWVQARGLPLPEYEIVNRSGPDHAPLFEIEVRVRGVDPVSAEGSSRRVAEKAAASNMLRVLKGMA